MKWIKAIVCTLIFCVCIGLVIYGQKTVGIKNLLLMFVGLLGILGLLFAYNKKYQ